MAPGVVDPQNPLIPFAQFATLHFARVLVLEDMTLDDITAYGLPRVNYPIYLAMLADFDGSAEKFVAELIQQCGRRTEAHLFLLRGLSLRTPISVHGCNRTKCSPATAYVNWIGRTVQQVGEEAALHDALVSYVRQNARDAARDAARRRSMTTLTRYVRAEQQAGQA